LDSISRLRLWRERLFKKALQAPGHLRLRVINVDENPFYRKSSA
jgi:hypothetical protein